jgi:hypothetical protein
MTNRQPELRVSHVDDALAHERASATPFKSVRKTGVLSASAGMTSGEPAMLSLEQQQRWFQTAVTHPESLEAGVVATGIPAGRVIEPSTALGLEVYHHAYRARLIECLVDDYPALQYALGAEQFTALASSYIVRHPSDARNLNGFGRHMESFCRECSHPLGCFWGDLARLEWMLVEILHAEDAPPLAVESLAAIRAEAWGAARLVPSETLRILVSDFPVNEFFQAFKNDDAPDVPRRAPQALAVYRQGLTLFRMTLTPPMADLLMRLVRGETLGTAFVEMEAHASDPAADEEAARNVMAWFSAWVQAGFFRAIELPGDGHEG